MRTVRDHGLVVHTQNSGLHPEKATESFSVISQKHGVGLRVLIPQWSGKRVGEKGPGTDAGRLAEGLDREGTP